MIRVTGPGRAEVEDGADATALGDELDRAFAEDGVRIVAWWVPVGDWAARRTAWRLGFTYGGTLRGWLPTGDAWVFSLAPGDTREPRTRWLENPVIERDGLRLRPLETRDVPRLVTGMADAETQHWLSFLPREPGKPQGQEYVDDALERLADDNRITWAFASTDDDLLLGALGLFRLDYEPELGFWAHPEARRRRLTTRAAAMAVDHAFDVLDLPVVSAFAAVGNTGSIRVLEGLGMRRIGVLRRLSRTGDGELSDVVGYDVVPEDWAELRRSRDADQKSTPMPAIDSAAPTSAGAR